MDDPRSSAPPAAATSSPWPLRYFCWAPLSPCSRLHFVLRWIVLASPIVLLTSWYKGRFAPLPVRLTDHALLIALPRGETLETDWSNIASARVVGVLESKLLIEPLDPRDARPPILPGQRSPEYQMAVLIKFMTPGRDVLRRELDRRIPGRTGR